MKNVPIILASSSPRRRELLQHARYAFEVVSPPLPEPPLGMRELLPRQQAEALAYFKARAVADLRPGSLIIGADTIVALGKEILGKPLDEPDARRMLRLLSASRHQVITGVAILGPRGTRMIASDVTHVHMVPMSNDDIEQYIASREWEGKAGAYAIQETADRYIARVDGSFTNVVGMPMELLERMMAECTRRADCDKPSLEAQQ